MCVWSDSVKRQCEEKEQQLAVLKETLSSAQKEVTELRSCLREVERSRLEARRELQELRRQVRHAATSLLLHLRDILDHIVAITCFTDMSKNSFTHLGSRK